MVDRIMNPTLFNHHSKKKQIETVICMLNFPRTNADYFFFI